MLGAVRHAQADCEADRNILGDKLIVFYLLPDTLRDDHRPVQRRFRQYNNKLVSSISTDYIGFP